MAKDSPSFTIPVSPEAEYLLDRYLEEFRQYLLLRASLIMGERIGVDGVTLDDMKSAITSHWASIFSDEKLFEIVATEWNNRVSGDTQATLKKLATPGLPRDKPNT